MTATSPTIAELLARSGTGFDNRPNDFDMLNAALDAAGLTGALDAPDADLTLFAPTDAAFIRLAQSLGYAGSDEAGAFGAIVDALTTLGGGDPIPLLTQVLTFHVAPSARTAAEIASQTSISTLAGLAISPFGLSLGDLDPTAADPRIIFFRADQQAGNGIIQAIDRVLLPADLPEAVPSQPALPTLSDLLAASGPGFDTNPHDYDILNAALDATGLADVLANADATLTLLAPTDNAFLKLSRTFGYFGRDEGEAFSAIAAGLSRAAPDGDPIPLLTEILTYHVTGGSFSRAQLDAAGDVMTVQGGTLAVEGRFIIDADPDTTSGFLGAKSDIQAANGVLHSINGVLLPFDYEPSIAELLAQSGAGFDSNFGDFDILNAALDAAGLTSALADASAELTLFAPTDAAFLKLARALGYRGHDEQGVFDTIVGALTTLGGGDPIPLLTTVLTYHLAPQALTAAQIAAADSIATLAADGSGSLTGSLAITPDGTRLGDLDPSVPDPNLIGWGIDRAAGNGFIQTIDRVLLPADLI
jgi:uncharacterized surface protein with fasciclin (FAS1) repeats